MDYQVLHQLKEEHANGKPLINFKGMGLYIAGRVSNPEVWQKIEGEHDAKALANLILSGSIQAFDYQHLEPDAPRVFRITNSALWFDCPEHGRRQSLYGKCRVCTQLEFEASMRSVGCGTQDHMAEQWHETTEEFELVQNLLLKHWEAQDLIIENDAVYAVCPKCSGSATHRKKQWFDCPHCGKGFANKAVTAYYKPLYPGIYLVEPTEDEDAQEPWGVDWADYKER